MEDDSYDLVVNCWMLNYLTDKQRLAVVHEVVRITRPGGRIRLQGGHEDADGSQKTPELNVKGEANFPSLDLRRLEYWALELKVIEKVERGTYVIGKKTVLVEEDSEDTFLALQISK